LKPVSSGHSAKFVKENCLNQHKLASNEIGYNIELFPCVFGGRSAEIKYSSYYAPRNDDVTYMRHTSVVEYSTSKIKTING